MQSQYPLPVKAAELRTVLQQQRNWQDSYRILIQSAKNRTTLPEDKRTPVNKVSGCEANVWFWANGTADCLQFLFFSEARMVDALIYAAFLPLQGQPAHFIANFDVQQWLNDCHLANHLSPSRSNGLHQVVQAAKRTAESYL